MQGLKILKKIVVDSQIFVSLMGTLLAVYFMHEQEVFRWPTVCLIFITYFSGYLYTKYQSHKNFNKILIVNILSFIICAVLIFLNHHETRLLKWLAIVLLGLFYNSRFLERFVRKIPLLKVFYVGLVWALVNAWLILPEFHSGIFTTTILFVSALVLPFDIRDMEEDNVVTFPQFIGVQNTKYLAYLLLFFATTIAILCLKTEYKTSFFITFAFTTSLVYFTEKRNSDCYFSFWVELCSGLPFLILILLN